MRVSKTKDGRKFFCTYTPVLIGEHTVIVSDAFRRQVFSAPVHVAAEWVPEAASLRALGPGLFAGATRRPNQFALLPPPPLDAAQAASGAAAAAATAEAMANEIERYVRIEGPSNSISNSDSNSTTAAATVTATCTADGCIDVQYEVASPGVCSLCALPTTSPVVFHLTSASEYSSVM